MGIWRRLARSAKPPARPRGQAQEAPTPDSVIQDDDGHLASGHIDAAKVDAIHRALLSGLLSNVGVKTAPREYTGIHGSKFLIFPASALAAHAPQWVMAAEIVETSRLYARTVAAIKPHMIERLAGHLISRSYSEPHWQAESAHVIAFEKVTLGGLVLAPRRAVHYGPIDPIISRQLFILHALVEGEFKTNAPFFTHNRRLIDNVHRLENRLRRRDLLAEAESRYAFFDQRIPPGIFNGPLFEKWRRGAEQRNRRLLYMSEQDLLRGNAGASLEALYPDRLEFGSLELELSYVFDVESADDGVTANVPLAAVNQLDEDAIEWLVPGYLPVKIEALMRSLPKLARTQFVPIPEFASRAAVDLVITKSTSLVQALVRYLNGFSQVKIHASDFDARELPVYLSMNIRVVDTHGRVVAEGRDLAEIRKSVGLRARQSFALQPDPVFHRDHLRDWDFPDLPPSVQVQREGLTLLGYPALVDASDEVNLRLFDNAEAADVAHAFGALRLFMIRSAGELKYLTSHLPHWQQTSLNYGSVGPGAALKQSIATAVAKRVFIDDQPPVRTRADFTRRITEAWPKLSAASIEITNAIGPALAIYARLAVRLSERFPELMQPSIADMKEQLAQLVYPEFAAKTPQARLIHLSRYLQGISTRLDKLTNSGLGRDQAGLRLVTPPWKAYLAAAETKDELALDRHELQNYRWLIEEFRVSLFAQELKTSVPVSQAKLEQQWDKVLKRR